MSSSESVFLNLDFLSWARQREEFLCGRVSVLKKATFGNLPRSEGKGFLACQALSYSGCNTIIHGAAQSKMLFP